MPQLPVTLEVVPQKRIKFETKEGRRRLGMPFKVATSNWVYVARSPYSFLLA